MSFLTPRFLSPGVWLWLPTSQLLVPVPSRCWAPSTCSGPFLAAPRQAAWVTAGRTDLGDPRLPPRRLPPCLRLLAFRLWGLLKLSPACTFQRRQGDNVGYCEASGLKLQPKCPPSSSGISLSPRSLVPNSRKGTASPEPATWPLGGRASFRSVGGVGSWSLF